jgi:hypothetical protein
MSVQIINRTKRLTIIPLNSGESIHLAPGEKSPPIEEFELENNAKVQKLLKADLIAHVGGAAAAHGAAKDSKKHPRKST